MTHEYIPVLFVASIKNACAFLFFFFRRNHALKIQIEITFSIARYRCYFSLTFSYVEKLFGQNVYALGTELKFIETFILITCRTFHIILDSSRKNILWTRSRGSFVINTRTYTDTFALGELSFDISVGV